MMDLNVNHVRRHAVKIVAFALLTSLAWATGAAPATVLGAQATKALTIEPASLFGCFIPGEPLRFTLKADGRAGQSMIVAATDYDDSGHIFQKQTVKLDASGRATVNLHALPRGPYMLRVTSKADSASQLEAARSFVVMGDPPAAPKDVESEWLGLCTHLDRITNERQLDQMFEMLRRIGPRWVRFNYQWDKLQTGPNQFSDAWLSRYDRLTHRLKQAGIRFFGILIATPDWASDSPANAKSRWRFPPRDWDNWRQFVAKVVGRYHDASPYFEIWNEPGGFISIDGLESNYPGGKHEVVFKFNRIARQIAHKISPDAVIIGPSANTNDVALIADTLAKAPNSIDVLSFHYPRHPLQTRGTAQQLNRLIDRHAKGGEALPLWFTETQHISGAKGENQTVETVKRYIRAWAEGIGKLRFIYTLRNTWAKPGSSEDIDNLISVDGQPRPGVVALQTIYNRLRDAQFVGVLDLPEPLEGYLYLRHAAPGVVVWSKNSTTAPAPTSLVDANTVAFDVYGNAVNLADLHIGPWPIYLEKVSVQGAALGNACVQLRPYRYQLDRGRTEHLSLTLANPGDAPHKVQVAFTDPQVDVTPAAINRTLNPGQIVRVPVELQTAADSDAGIGYQPLKATVNGRPTQVGHLLHFDQRAMHSIEVADFSRNSLLWQENGQWIGSFAHAFYNYQPYHGAPRDYRTVRLVDDPAGGAGVVAEFWADWYQRKKPTWVAAYFGRGVPKKIPGVPTRCRMSIRAPKSMLKGNFTILVRFRDATGEHFQFEITRHVVPNDRFQEFATTIDSPLSSNYIHSHWGGNDDGLLQYPAYFEGFALNVGPQLYKNNRFRGGVQVRWIKVDCYQPKHMPRDPADP